MTHSIESIPKRHVRPFYFSDGMVISAATALGLALAGLWHRELSEQLPVFFKSAWPTSFRTRVAGYALSALIPASITILALRVRPPRPRLRRMARQPGTVASIASIVAVVCQLFALPLELRTMGGMTSPFLVAAWYWPTTIGVAVLAVWIIQAFSRTWRADGDWIDRAGMLIGLACIGLPIGLATVEFL